MGKKSYYQVVRQGDPNDPYTIKVTVVAFERLSEVEDKPLLLKTQYS